MSDLQRDAQAVVAGRLSRRRFIERGLAAGVSMSTLGAVLSACGSGSSKTTASSLKTGAPKAAGKPPAVPTGTLTFGADQPLSQVQWDYYNASSATDRLVASYVHDTLLAYDADGNFVNRLATEFTPLDISSAHVKLRPGVHYHDGQPFSAKDVKATLERFNTPAGQKLVQAGIFPRMKVEVIDDLTLTIRTLRPYAALKPLLTVAPILPAGDIADPSLLKKRPMGVGPYRWLGYADPDIKATVNEHYWAGTPHIKNVVTRIITDQDARLNALKSGQIDLIDEATVNQITAALADKSLFVSSKRQSPPGQFIYLYNMISGPLRDIRLRHAIAYAIDRNALASGILKGLYPTPNSMLATSDPYYKAQPAFAYDPAKAQALVKQVSPSGPVKLSIASSTLYQWQADVDQAVAQFLNQAGFKVTITKYDLGAYGSQLGKSDMLINGYGGSNPDPDYVESLVTQPLAAALQIQSSPTYERLRAQEQQTTGAARRAAFDRFQAYAWNQQPWYPIADLTFYQVASTRIQNYQRGPTAALPLLSQWWLS